MIKPPGSHRPLPPRTSMSAEEIEAACLEFYRIHLARMQLCRDESEFVSRMLRDRVFAGSPREQVHSFLSNEGYRLAQAEKATPEKG